jgi:chemosensory pili system protein ChpA (sensor histidine kinase/response regulator)
MSDHPSRARVLCVDDDRDQRLLLSFLLERHGMDVRTARDGQEGVMIALEWSPDLILMDLMMPDMNGFQATETLRADPRTEHIPILALTAYGEENMQDKARAVGINSFVLKTTLPANLLETLREYLPSLAK